MVTKHFESKAISSLNFKFPTYRDNIYQTGDLWLLGKSIDDGIDNNLWRIHDKLYNFTEFIKNHPGGTEWLIYTKGTDITEAFESHHLTGKAEQILTKYYVGPALKPRNSPFTFHKNGFYKILKQEVVEALKDIPEGPAIRSKLITDALFLSFIATAIMAAVKNSFIWSIVSGLFLALVTIAAHNFFHQKNNFRMLYFNFSFLSYRQWRITHALSHHLYTNTVQDIEISAVEPFFQFLPTEKSRLYLYFCWIYTPIIYLSVFFMSHIKVCLYNLIWNKKMYWDEFLPYFVLTLMYLIGDKGFLQSLSLFFTIVLVSSFYFTLVGLNAGHHHPESFHDGDKPRPKEELDWGIHQLDAVMDRTDITGSHFLVLTNFGDHGLHHLFPTVDHGKLSYLYPVFEKTCDKFGIKLRFSNQLDIIKNQFLHLIKTEPNKNPPKPLKINKMN